MNLRFRIAITVAISVAAAALRITCVGDSITEGGGCLAESYVDLLRADLGSGYEVLNAGASGQTMLKGGLCNGDYSSCTYWGTSQWRNALNSEPDIVTIMLGTNDAKAFNWEGVQQNTGDYFALDYVDMIRTLRSLKSHPKIYALVPPPLYEPFPFEMNATVINTIYPKLIRDIASVMDVEIIDVFSQFNASTLTCDGCHPTHEGNVLISDAIATAVKAFETGKK
jgi:acyl-CoA thioesterase-1